MISTPRLFSFIVSLLSVMNFVWYFKFDGLFINLLAGIAGFVAAYYFSIVHVDSISGDTTDDLL